MTDKRWRIGISCVGSGVGQSVINSCRLSRLPLYTLGLGINPFAFGAYDCDEMVDSPEIYTPDYCKKLIEILKKHRIDLVIPGLDDEAHLFARSQHLFEEAGIQTITSGERLIQLCRDKEEMGRELGKIADVFVRSYSPAAIRAALKNGEVHFPLIAKPRGGFASRGIEILLDESDLERVTAQHIVQELAIPHRDDPNRGLYMRQIERRINPQLAEISIQLVTGRDGKLLGRMASYNKLHNGVPIEIVPYENDEVWSVVDRLFPTLCQLGLRGPINIHGRLTEGGLKLFEMNPRFTGITGLRALMGFNEVEACIRSWLGLSCPIAPLHINSGTFGCRQVADRAVPLDRNEDVRNLSVKLNKPGSPKKPVLLLTGATGYLGRHVAQMAQATYEVWTLDRNKEKSRKCLSGLEGLQTFDHHDLHCGNLPLGHVDVLLHAAFARPRRGEEEIAGSLAFTQDLFTRAAQHQGPSIINISSQSVYGLRRPPLWSEALPPAPETPYAQAKLASELMLASAMQYNRQVCGTSLRISTLAGGEEGLDECDLLSRLSIQALRGESLTMLGGVNRMSRLDIRDAVGAIRALLCVPSVRWAPCYNVDSEEGCDLQKIARFVAEVVARLSGRPAVDVLLAEKETADSFGMDASRFRADTGWAPKFTIMDTIESVVHYYLNSPEFADLKYLRGGTDT